MTRAFSHEPLAEVVDHLRAALDSGATAVTIRVPDPDRGHGRYPGEPLDATPAAPRHRPLRTWTELADRLQLRLHTPRRPSEQPDSIELRFEPLDLRRPLLPTTVPRLGKYGPDSEFGRASKLEEPDFLLDMADAMERIALPAHAEVLSLGVNTGDELRAVQRTNPTARFTGIDHDDQALEVARRRYGTPHRFITADLNSLPELPRFDLVMCIDTLQSPGVDDRAVLRHLVQRLLGGSGSVLLGLPNCRHVDGELLHGARMVNFRQPELSLLLKGVAFYKKYLQQHHKKVFVTGKHEILVTAVPLRR